MLGHYRGDGAFATVETLEPPRSNRSYWQETITEWTYWRIRPFMRVTDLRRCSAHAGPNADALDGTQRIEAKGENGTAAFTINLFTQQRSWPHTGGLLG